MSDEVRVDPPVLRAAAGVSRDLRAGLTSGLSDVEPETVAADGGLPGWHTQRALRDLLWWWRDDLTKLGQRLDSTAEALDACATDYEHSDHASESHFYRAVHPW